MRLVSEGTRSLRALPHPAVPIAGCAPWYGSALQFGGSSHGAAANLLARAASQGADTMLLLVACRGARARAGCRLLLPSLKAS